jgi:hypothetical protein
VLLSNIRIYAQGGGTKEQAALDPPEKEDTYPEPSMFGDLPAYGFFIRHVRGLKMRDIDLNFLRDDVRPAFVLNDVNGADFHHVNAKLYSGASTFDLKNVSDFRCSDCGSVPDTRLPSSTTRKL